MDESCNWYEEYDDCEYDSNGYVNNDQGDDEIFKPTSWHEDYFSTEETRGENEFGSKLSPIYTSWTCYIESITGLGSDFMSECETDEHQIEVEFINGSNDGMIVWMRLEDLMDPQYSCTGIRSFYVDRLLAIYQLQSSPDFIKFTGRAVFEYQSSSLVDS